MIGTGWLPPLMFTVTVPPPVPPVMFRPPRLTGVAPAVPAGT